ncbi:hypothetical protein [Pseudomonas sp. Y24-6]|uniref:hypothetical protein n=1 Tax=Pseudomonas sp. Y24-6 TaxID=2750013 RepID=UPI001CE1E0C8|nr:hypothetical protein [Pseudomonas sp. Y24-6]MCA4963571.1 hypothetical protein [Pseudomonas sp. Y24-6]
MPWTIESALDNECLEHTEKTLRGYSFWLKGIPTEIQVVLYVNAQKGGFNFHLSHLIYTPEQANVYQPSQLRGDYEAYALHSAISAVTDFYSIAVKAGHVPCKSWLLENVNGI